MGSICKIRDRTVFKFTEVVLITLFFVSFNRPLSAFLKSGEQLVFEGEKDSKAPAGVEAKEDNGSEERCDLYQAASIADWLNSINIGSFFDDSGKYPLKYNDCSVAFDCFENLRVWVEPYGFYSHYKAPLSKDDIDLKQTSFGSGIGARYLFSDELQLGSGLGYFHSNLKTGGEEETINGIYFGPAVKYSHFDGWASCTLFGMTNFGKSWDIDLRVETEYNLEASPDFFIDELSIQPFLRVDYLNVFEFEHTSRHASFFYSKLGARFGKELFCTDSIVVTPHINIGWVNMTPISSQPFECKGKKLDTKPESKNQLALGLAVVGVCENAMIVGLEYEAFIGAQAPTQTGRIRFEWNW
jgi:hypothetical protein